eukprot:CAMPEP_0172940488 /NCGR_PEP_ID=MMETSP1075-20121228/224060_1 /TAXON_ID=2916 /ORGANISM="Ceratium fusus, Strain PA161109" /LENGTH=169 /DNA_ID=CAMNT_0013801887 /DNA_START=50 /DNA_END=559 /DNA_ORIENTATION=+
MVSMASEENNCVAANQPAQRAGKRTSSPAAKATLNGGAPKTDPKAQAAADGKSQDKKPLKKPPAMGMAGLLLLVMCVLTVSVHLFFGISFLTKLGMPFAGALKECRIPLGITVVGMLIGAAAFAKRLRANGAGALKECRIPLGITVVGMLIGAAAFAKRLRANGQEKAS